MKKVYFLYGVTFLWAAAVLGLLIAVVVEQQNAKNQQSKHIEIYESLRNNIDQVRQSNETNQDQNRQSFQETQHQLFHQVLQSVKLQSMGLKRSGMITTTVLIPIYNGVEYFQECWESLQKQTHLPESVIIGMNGHSEGSASEKTVRDILAKSSNEILRSRSSVLVYEKPSKVQTLNRMMEQVKTNYVALLDVDDIWLPEKLQKQVELLERFDLDVIGTHCEYFGEKSGSVELPSGLLNPRDIYTKNPIINSSCIVKTELAHWSEEFTALEDYELWLRLASQKRTFFNVPENLVKHRISADSFFNSKPNHREWDALQKTYFLNFS